MRMVDVADVEEGRILLTEQIPSSVLLDSESHPCSLSSSPRYEHKDKEGVGLSQSPYPSDTASTYLVTFYFGRSATSLPKKALTKKI